MLATTLGLHLAFGTTFGHVHSSLTGASRLGARSLGQGSNRVICRAGERWGLKSLSCGWTGGWGGGVRECALGIVGGLVCWELL